MTPAEYELAGRLALEAVGMPLADRTVHLNKNCPQGLRAFVERLVSAHENPEEILARMSDAAQSWIGRKLDVYQILKEIGRGGMGTVYLGQRTQDYSQFVAIKVLRSTSRSGGIERFLHERQTMARLEHPNIARLLDGGITEAGEPYLVMEYVENGRPITEYCHAMRLTIEQRLSLFIKVCEAVQYAHYHKVLHRDLKPANILVTPEGVPKLLDFGVAKSLDPDVTLEASLRQIRTQTGSFVGTLTYASPEQVRGEPLSAASDVYALGLILYEMLTGTQAFPLEDRLYDEAIRIICEEDPESPSTMARRLQNERAVSPETRPESGMLRGDLDAITLKALQKRTQERYASAAAISQDVQRHLNSEPIEARPRSWWSSARRQIKRRRLLYAVSFATCAALLVGLTISFFQWKRAATQANEALSRKLVADAYSVMNSKNRDIDLAALLSLEALKRFHSSLTMDAVSQVTSLLPRVETSVLLPDMGNNKDAEVDRISFDGETNRVLAQSPDRIYIWESASKGSIRQIERKGKSWADSRRLRYGARATDNGLDVFDLSNGRIVLHRDTRFGRGAEIIENPDRAYLTISDAPETGLYNLPDGSPQFKITLQSNRCLFGACFGVQDYSPQELILWKGGTIEVSSYDKNPKRTTLKGNHTFCQFTPSRDYLVCMDAQGISAFDGKSGSLLSHIAGHSTGQFSFSNKFIYIVDENAPNYLLVEEAKSGREVARHEFPYSIKSLDADPKDAWVAVGDSETVRLWAPLRSEDENVPPLQIPLASERKVTFSPDGRFLMVKSSPGMAAPLQIWDPSSRTEIFEVAPPVLAASWSEDGRLAVAKKLSGSRQSLIVLDPKSSNRIFEHLDQIANKESGALPIVVQTRLASLLESGKSVVLGECGECSCDGRKCLLPSRQESGFTIQTTSSGGTPATKTCEWSSSIGSDAFGREFGLSTDGLVVGALTKLIAGTGTYGTISTAVHFISTLDCHDFAKIPIAGTLLAVRSGGDYFYVITLESAGQARLDAWKRIGSALEHTWSKANVGNWAFSNSGRHSYFTSGNDALLFDAATTRAEVVGKNCTGGAFSENGAFLAFVCAGGINVAQTSDAKVKTIHVNSDSGSEVITVANAGSPVLVRTQAGNLEALGRDGEIKGYIPAPGTGTIVGAYLDQSQRVYLATLVTGKISLSRVASRPQDLAKAGCVGLTRNLTPSEWQQYLRDEPYKETCFPSGSR